MKARKWLWFAIPAASIVLGLIVLPLTPCGEYIRYWNSDAVERVGIETRWKLAAYERSGNPTELRAWFTSLDGGLGKQKMLETIIWSEGHQDAFISLVRGMEPGEQKHFIDSFLTELGQCSGVERFTEAFKGRDEPAIREILRKIGG